MIDQLLGQLTAVHAKGQGLVFTALIETRGSTPQKPGATMLVYGDGSQFGTLGGGCVEAEVKRQSLLALETGEAKLVTFQLDHDYGWDDGLICGGRMTMVIAPIAGSDSIAFFEQWRALLGRGCTVAADLDEEEGPALLLFNEDSQLIESWGRTVAIDEIVASLRDLKDRPRPYVAQGWSYLPFLKRCELVIVGAGHVGQKVAAYANDADFDVTIIDDRESLCNANIVPSARKHLVGSFEEILPRLEFGSSTFCIIVTRGHSHDELALSLLIHKQARYLGMIGSKRKIRLIFDNLRADGVSDALLASIHAPLGLEIGSQTVPEIAISIVAELIQVRNSGAGSPA